MKRYTPKPIPIIAIQFNGDNMDEVKKFLDSSYYRDYEINKDHLIKERFILIGWQHGHSLDILAKNSCLYLQKGDYLFVETNKDGIYEKHYKRRKKSRPNVVDFLKKAEFERKYEVEHD